MGDFRDAALFATPIGTFWVPAVTFIGAITAPPTAVGGRQVWSFRLDCGHSSHYVFYEAAQEAQKAHMEITRKKALQTERRGSARDWI